MFNRFRIVLIFIFFRTSPSRESSSNYSGLPRELVESSSFHNNSEGKIPGMLKSSFNHFSFKRFLVREHFRNSFLNSLIKFCVSYF